MALTPAEALARAGVARQAMETALGADRPAAYPDAAQRAYSVAMTRYSDAVARRVAQGGGLEAMRLDLLELTERFAPAARAMARTVSANAKSEVARMVGKKRLQARIPEDEKAFVQVFAESQLALLRKNVDRQVAALGEALAIGRPVDEVLWVSRQGAQNIAFSETQRLSEDAVGYWAQLEGSEDYVWDTAQDEKVRHGHALLHGTVHRYDNPPEKNDGFGRGHPGTSPRCRCRKRPRFPEA